MAEWSRDWSLMHRATVVRLLAGAIERMVEAEYAGARESVWLLAAGDLEFALRELGK